MKSTRLPDLQACIVSSLVMAAMSKTGASWATYCRKMSVIQELVDAGQLLDSCCNSSSAKGTPGNIYQYYSVRHKAAIDLAAAPFLEKVPNLRKLVLDRFKDLRSTHPEEEKAALLKMLVGKFPKEYKQEDMASTYPNRGWVYNVLQNCN